MKAYLITTGLAFGAVLVAHAMRLAAEGWNVATQPMFAGASVIAGGMCAWAVVLLRRPSAGA